MCWFSLQGMSPTPVDAVTWSCQPTRRGKFQTLLRRQAPNLSRNSAVVGQRHLSLGKWPWSEDRQDCQHNRTSCRHNIERPETLFNVATTAASLTSELPSENKNIVAALQDNARLEHLIGQCKLGGWTSKKTGTGENLSGTHYCCSYGYDSGHPRFKCTDKKTGSIMNATRANMQGG